MFKRTLLVSLMFALVVLLAACANPASSSSYQAPSTGNSNSSQTTSTPTAAATTAGLIVKTAQAQVKGASQTILTDAQGMTLYYFTPDTSTQATCNGGCAAAWPPALFQGSGTIPHASSLQGTLSLLKNGDKSQIVYNGHPLYTFSGDTSAGQTNGEGVGGKWFVAVPDLKQQGTPTTKGY
ncbi:COG4315 family predicted lipoprotein [Dictyobacter kobayashii]|uniref:Lipoprotein n=1 Tax=Dictyobacter kobayashii TaxID=2014872 RepID=A0A402AZD9_9CHLR|nr:hypothetical protein [Dictyobacter kobayashii]GCE24437.1 hypothetical protein KDK_82370 [Dictyobacter kobayashii]